MSRRRISNRRRILKSQLMLPKAFGVNEPLAEEVSLSDSTTGTISLRLNQKERNTLVPGREQIRTSPFRNLMEPDSIGANRKNSSDFLVVFQVTTIPV